MVDVAAGDACRHVTVPYPLSQAMLTNLRVGVTYEVKVAMFSNNGYGPFSHPVDVYIGIAGKIVRQMTNVLLFPTDPFRGIRNLCKLFKS